MPYQSKTIFIALPIGKSAVSDYFLYLAEELVKRGYLLILITWGKKTQASQTTTNPAIYSFPSKRPVHFKDALYLARLIKRYKPIAIISNFGAQNISILVSWLFGVPLRYASYHSQENRYLKEYNINILYDEYQKKRKSLVYKFTSMIFPVSEAMIEEIINIYNVPLKKIKCFHNALEDPKLDIRSNIIDENKIICVGRLDYGKGQDVLIKAMDLVHQKKHEIKLDIVGAGINHSILKEMVDELNLNKVVEFIGQVPHQQIFSLMSDAYAVIVPSRFEAFCFVVIEAMSVGVPVIASHVGGIPEIIRDKIDGFLVPPENPEILASRILDLFDDKELHRTMQLNARQRFLNEFELKKAINSQANWLEESIDQLFH